MNISVLQSIRQLLLICSPCQNPYLLFLCLLAELHPSAGHFTTSSAVLSKFQLECVYPFWLASIAVTLQSESNGWSTTLEDPSILQQLPSVVVLLSPFWSRWSIPGLQVCKKTCYQPWTLGPSSKGRNSNILGSISMINMRSIESLKYSSVVPQKSAGNCLARSSIRPSRTSARCVLCSSFRFSSLFFLGLNGRVFLLKSCSVWNTLCNVFWRQEKFVERCFQIPP